MEEKDFVVWLNSLHGIGSKTMEKLINFFGSAEKVFYASSENLSKVKGINQNAIHTILKNQEQEKVLEIKNKLHSAEIEVIGKWDLQYPENLKNIYDPPCILYKRGNILTKDTNSIAIVGSRKASAYGKWAAYKLAGELAKAGITIVSGMAYGIDTIAHKAALENGGRTIAVLGCGLDTCYPKSNFNLMKEIEKNGAVLSEYCVGMQPLPENFPARNRIISGIARAVLVIEANIKSGSLITVEFALEQGRDVLAVPGNINSNLSAGTNKLIKEGARLVTCVEDILDELGIEMTKINNNQENINLGKDEQMIYHVISENQPIHIEQIAQKLKENISKVSSIVTILQLKGLIEQLPGKILIINK